MKKTYALKKVLSLSIALIIAMSGLVGAYGTYYKEANPKAVNEGLSTEEVEANDLEAFSKTSGYDYHNSTDEDYAPNEIILEIISSDNNTTNTVSSFENDYGLEVERILKTDEITDNENYTSLESVGSIKDNVVITSYFMKTNNDDIVSLCDKLNKNDEVFNAQPNFKYTTCEDNSVNMAESSVTSYKDPSAFSTSNYQSNLQWWFDYCNISSGWASYADSSTGYGMGAGVTVAVIDTGCNTNHEDIKANLWSYPSDTSKCGYFAYKSSYIAKNDSAVDVIGHGSHCCGTIAMNGDNSVGGIGTAPKSKIMVMKADRNTVDNNTGKGVFYDSEIITSLEKSASLGADIISMSLGGYSFSYSTFRTYQKISSSCLILCAAGNDHLDTSEKLFFPASASCNMGIMALNTSSSRAKLAYFSNTDTSGNFYKVVAPGTAIWSLDYSSDTGYCNKQGTSMATPAAAGMIASYMSYIKGVKGWNWTPAQYQYKVENLMNSSSNSITCTDNSKTSPAYLKGSVFKVMNLNALFSGSQSNTFSSVNAVSFNNSTVRDGVTNSTGLTAAELDKYALMRVSLMYWPLSTTRNGITDYSDLSKLTGLNYLDLTSSKVVTQSNFASTIANCSPSLIYLDLNTSSKISDISALAIAPFSNLYFLDISSNSLSSIGAISKFTSLQYLYAGSNSIEDISALNGITHILNIDLSNNSVQDPTPAFASQYLHTIDLSHNKISDYNQLYLYKGAYVSSSFNSSTINFNVSYNYMPNLTATIASDIKSKITDNNTKNGTLYATTINFTYSNQSTGSFTPMTSYNVSNTTVSRESFCSGNLNTSSLTGFKAYPTSANQYKYLTWTCDEEGYCNPDGTISITPDRITSTRTLKFTATAPVASSATSLTTKTASQSIFITVTAPEIYNSYLSDRVVKTASSVRIMVSVSASTSKLVLRSGTGASSTNYAVYDLSSEVNASTNANDQCKTYLLTVPSSVTATAGTYSLYLYSADSNGNYTVGTSKDISGYTTYAYKSLGSLYVKDSPETSSNISVTANSYVNRYGESAIFASNAGTLSSSPAKDSGAYGFSMSSNAYLGTGTVYTSFGAGFLGKTASGYPRTSTGKSTVQLTLTDSASNKTTADASITTVAPCVNSVNVNNSATYSSDGYIEYLVKTNNATTGIKTIKAGATSSIESENELIITALSSTSSYAYYSSSSSYKLWKLRVPLVSSSAQEITIVAYDALGDGSVTKTPATKVTSSGSSSIYPDDTSYSVYYPGNITYYPVDENGVSLADCCKTLTYSMTSSSYFTLTSASTGRVTCDMQKFLQTYKSGKSTYVRVSATLESGSNCSAYVYVYKPYVESFKYNADKSNRVPQGTVYYTAKTYGSDSINISNSSTVDTSFKTLTLNDTDAYTIEKDEDGHKYILWNFERQFDDTGTKISTYVRSSYDLGDTVNIPSYSYSYLNVTSEAVGDYSNWEEQTARLNNVDMTELSSLYGDNSQLFDSRLSAVTDGIDNAVKNYSLSHQDKIDAQTDQLKELIDALFGYDEYSIAVNSYNEKITAKPDFYYIPQELSDLLTLTITDLNAKDTANRITAFVDALEGKADTSRYDTAVASIPSTLEDVMHLGSGYYVYTPSSISAVKEAMKLGFSLPAPISKQSEIDNAAVKLENAVNALNASFLDITSLEEILENESTYTLILSQYTLPNNLSIAYTTELEKVKAGIKKVQTSDDVNNLYTAMLNITNSIDAFKSAIDELRDYADFISGDENVPQLKQSELTNSAYSDETYTPLKEKYDEIITKLADKNSGFTDTASVRKALSEIKPLFDSLHKHDFSMLIGETCTYKYMKCECGKYAKVSYSGEEESSHSHNWGETISVNAPLCDGTSSFSYHQCKTCGAIEYLSNAQTITSTLHHWVEKGSAEISDTANMVSENVSVIKPTCTKNGSEIYVCKDCGAFYSKDIAPLDHDYSGEWILTTPPSETTEGIETNTCTRCDSTITRPVAILPARANLIIPFTAGNYDAFGFIVKAYIHGADLNNATPDYVFTDTADAYGYKVLTNKTNKTLTIRLPINGTFDIVISKLSHTSFTIYGVAMNGGERDLLAFNADDPTKAVTATLFAGDINGDGKINALDKIALNHNLATVADESTKKYDLNNDNEINSADKQLLLQSYMQNSLSYTFE